MLKRSYSMSIHFMVSRHIQWIGYGMMRLETWWLTLNVSYQVLPVRTNQSKAWCANGSPWMENLFITCKIEWLCIIIAAGDVIFNHLQQVLEIPKQMNTNDCGVFVCMVSARIILFKSLNWTAIRRLLNVSLSKRNWIIHRWK